MALQVITYAIARREAKEQAAALEPWLKREQEEAAPYIAAVEAAAVAVAKEEGSIATRLAAYFKHKAAGDTPGEAEPSRVSPKLQQLRIELAEAEAAPFRAAVRHRQDQIDRLRSCPKPNPDMIEALGLGWNVSCPPKTEGDHDAAD